MRAEDVLRKYLGRRSYRVCLRNGLPIDRVSGYLYPPTRHSKRRFAVLLLCRQVYNGLTTMSDSFSESFLTIQRNPSMPQLAWIAKINRRNSSVSAVIGNSIEYGPDFLVAGVWDGPFKDGAF